MNKTVMKIIDATDSFMAFVFVLLGVALSQLLKAVDQTPALRWHDLLVLIASPRFVIFGVLAVMQTGREEIKGAKDDISKAAKKANFFDRMERAFLRGFGYTTAGTTATPMGGNT